MNEKKKITLNSIRVIGGICFILLALVTMFSNETPFAFLSIAITTAFGFVGFWILMPFLIVLGLFLVFKKRLIKFKLGLPLSGFFVMIVCFIILSSHWASIGTIYNGISLDGYSKAADGTSKYLIFSNSVQILGKIREANSSPFNPQLGGGYVGFILAGSINSAITPVGLNVVCWFFFCSALVMLLNKEIVKLVGFLKRKISKNHQERKPVEYKEVELASEEEAVIVAPLKDDEIVSNPVAPQPPVVEEKVASKPIYEQFHTSNAILNDYSLKKAHFVIPDENIMEDSMVKKIEDINTPSEPSRATFVEARFGEELAPESSPEVAPVAEEAPEVNPVVEPVIAPISEAKAPEIAPEVAPVVEEAPAPVVEEVDPLMRPQPKANLIKNYIYPSLDLLDLHEEADDASKNESSCEERTRIINEVFEHLRVGAQVVGHTVGPSVTRFDVQMNVGVSITVVPRYLDDISINLGGIPVRFEAIVAGKSTSGLEIPNEIRTNVGLRESIAALPTGQKYLMNIPFGKGISGDLKYANLAEFPHMLVSGTTGSGKSICVHATILTLIMRNKPEELKLVLVDPKKVEMAYYEDIPHLLCPIITDMRKTYNCFKKLVDEMERRYNLFQAHRLRDIKGFNQWCHDNDVQPLPNIVVFVDEYADLVEQVKEIREPVQRIVQKARAAGIHLCIATQRPSVNVIDGVIKSNVSTRLALMSASAVDSTTIIGEGGAEKLLGNGDMLIDCSLISRSTKPRVQGCYVSEAEINRVCDFLRDHYQPQYDPYFLDLEDHEQEKKGSNEPAVEAIDKGASEEQQYQDIKEQVMKRETCSISFIQRSFAMGFPRAGRIFARLIKEGVVADSGDSRGNKVLMHDYATNDEEQIGSIEQSSFIPDEPSGGGETL